MSSSKVNWGRSFSSKGSNVENQLVRLVLPQAHDLTLYLQPLRESADGLPASFISNYHVTVGTGGIALVNSWIPVPVVGVVRHFVADTIDVTAVTPGASATSPRIVGANVAIGRPSPVLEVGVFLATIGGSSPTRAEMATFLTQSGDANQQQIAAGINSLFRVPPYATHLEIVVTNKSAAILDTEMQVSFISPNGGTSAATALVSDFASPQPVPPLASLIKITNAAALGSFRVQLYFTCNQ